MPSNTDKGVSTIDNRHVQAMTSSHKLTGVLQGRTISGTSHQGDVLTAR